MRIVQVYLLERKINPNSSLVIKAKFACISLCARCESSSKEGQIVKDCLRNDESENRSCTRKNAVQCSM